MADAVIEDSPFIFKKFAKEAQVSCDHALHQNIFPEHDHQKDTKRSSKADFPIT